MFRARERGGVECVHADVDVAAFAVVLVAHPVLKGGVGHLRSSADALRRFARLRVAHQDGDSIGRSKVRANVFGWRYGPRDLIFQLGHGLDSWF